MSEETEEGPTTIEKIDAQSEEREEGPTTIDMANKQISIVETPIVVPWRRKIAKTEQGNRTGSRGIQN